MSIRISHVGTPESAWQKIYETAEANGYSRNNIHDFGMTWFSGEHNSPMIQQSFYKGNGSKKILTVICENIIPIELLSPESQYVVNHFIDAKVHSRQFNVNDEKHGAKMKGIESAINAGYLKTRRDRTNQNALCIVATERLSSLYF